MRRAAPIVCLVFLSALALRAQKDVGARWTGEWGSFKEARANGEMRSEGQRLSVTSCLNETCQAVISTAVLSGDHCDGSGELHIDSGFQATLTIKPPTPDAKNECVLVLSLREDGRKRTITVKSKSGRCAFYCTPHCSFERQFPFRSAAAFAGDDIPGCYLARSKALSAVCSDQALADLQKAWMNLSDSANALYAKPPNAMQLRDEAQAKCSSAEDPASCLRAFFRDDGARLARRKSQWQAGISQPGDAAEASRKAAAIAGVYTRSFNNATAQGKRYRSTDRLEIQPQPESKIGFKVDLNFANGHTCGIEGVAAYKANGAFVYRSDENGEACVLEIFAGENGVEFQDPLGGCKSYCGARGSLAGAKFSYSDRGTDPGKK